MPETSRECVVSLLDDTSFTVPVKSTLLGSELLDMAASHCKVKEKEYFGLMTEGEGYKNWLELDKAVLDPSQDLPKGTDPVKIYFCFKFFPTNLQMVQDFMTIDLLYLQCRQQIVKGEIATDPDTLYELAACALQASHGEYKNESEALQHLKVLPVIPAYLFKSCSVQSCESSVLGFYKMMQNLSRADAIFKYLDIVLTLPMYAIHYYEVKDKKEAELCIGVGYEGVSEYTVADKNEPLSRYQWIQLQNIYYKDKKFSIEVSTKGVNKPSTKGSLKVISWYASSPKLVMAIWKMTRDQHMFHRSSRNKVQLQTPEMFTNSTSTDIKRQLNKYHHSSLSPSSSQSSLSIESSRSNLTQASAEALAAAKAAQTEMYTALQNRRQALVQQFEQKAALYKSLLIKEMQITSVPPEGLAAEEIEKMRKKFGVNYKFSKFVLDESNTADGDTEVEELERQLEINSAIMDAEKNLLMQTKNTKIKKDRKKNLKQMLEKCQKLEERLNELKQLKNGANSKFHDNASPSHSQLPLTVPTRRRTSSPQPTTLDDSCLAQMIFSDTFSPNQKTIHHRSTSALSEHLTSAPKNATLPAVHSASMLTSKHLDFDSSESPNSSFSAYDDFDEVSTPSSLQGANTGPMVSQMGSKSMGTLRDFDLGDDMSDQFGQSSDTRSIHSGTSSRSGHRHHPIMTTGGPTRYDNSPTLGLPYRYQQDGLPMSPDRMLQSPDSMAAMLTNSYQQGGVVLRGGGTGPRNIKGHLGPTVGYGDEVGGLNTAHHSSGRHPRPHARTGSDEQYDIHEMLAILNDSPSNSALEFGGTLV